MRGDLQAGQIAAMVGNVMGGGKKKGKEPFTPSDFLLDVRDPDDSGEKVDKLGGARALYERKRRHGYA